MKSPDFLNEDIVTDAQDMKLDHEVQMARKDCYTAAENAIALHKLLRNISEQQGLEGWVAAKITLASDYLNTVREYLEYELLNMNAAPADVVGQTAEIPIAEGSVAKKPQSYNDPDWTKKLPKEKLDQLAGTKYKKDKKETKEDLEETTAGSVAGVVNPAPKNKAKVGSLFGGTYSQKKAK